MTTDDIHALAAIATEAGEILRQRFHEGVAYSTKAPQDLVADADREVEGLILSRLRAQRPGDGIDSEETGATSGGGDRIWIVDPLDGTANFIFGVPYFAVSIACQEGDRITLGVVYNPMTDELFHSGGDGAFLNARPIRCSARDDLRECLVVAGVSLIPENLERHLDEWGELFEQQRKGLALLSPALNICNVACGRTDVFLDFGSSRHGHSAAAFILQNAGGSVTTYDFSPWDHMTTGIVATNGKVGGQLAEARGQSGQRAGSRA